MNIIFTNQDLDPSPDELFNLDSSQKQKNCDTFTSTLKIK